jgi:hypothetical protein
MAVEPRRGCGFRKIGGLYLVSPPGGVGCDRLPFALDVCPTCGHGFKQSRGWTWVDVEALVAGTHFSCTDYSPMICPMCFPSSIPAGMLWVGEKFYHTTHSFSVEAAQLGISRRIKAIPREFELGKTWVLLAHPKAIWISQDPIEKQPGIFMIWKPKRIEKILPASKRDSTEATELSERGITPVFVPDNDPDHQASGYENETDDQLELINEETAVH